MTDNELQVSIDGARRRLEKDWRLGRPGSSIVLYDLARATAEAEVRGYRVKGPPLVGQLRLLPGGSPDTEVTRGGGMLAW